MARPQGEHIDPGERDVRAEHGRHRPGGAAGAEREQPLPDPLGDLGRDPGDGVRRGRGAAGLALLHPDRHVGDGQPPEEPGGDAPFVEGVLVAVHHLGVPQPDAARTGEPGRRDLTRGARADGEDGRVHLHAGRHAEDRAGYVAEGAEHVPRGAVAAREEQEVHTLGDHGAHRGNRVRRGGVPPGPGGVHDPFRESRGGDGCRAQRTGGGDDEEPVTGRLPGARRQFAQGRGRARLRQRACAQRQGRAGAVRAVGAAQADPAAEPGDRVDHQADLRHGRPVPPSTLRW